MTPPPPPTPATATLETRRFRGDESHTGAKEPARVIFRYGYVRLWSNWVGIVATVLVGIFVIYTLGTSTYVFAQSGGSYGSGISADTWTSLITAFVAPALVLIALFGGPLFAEDLRFNAPLFYFSRPLTVKDYFLGKAAWLVSIIVAASIAPVVLLILAGLVVGVPAASPPSPAVIAEMGPINGPAFMASWEAETLDSVGDWILATTITLPAVLVVVSFLVALGLLVSVYTRRGWHAAMAFVAVIGGLSMMHISVADSDSATMNLLGPTGWYYLMVILPMDMAFHSNVNVSADTQAVYDQAPFLLLVTYILVAGLAVTCYRLALRRVRQQEAFL